MSDRLFQLEVGAFGRDALRVLKFRGRERISSPYSFKVDVVAPDVDLGNAEAEMLAQPARLTFENDAGHARRVHGVIRKVRTGRADYRDGSRHQLTLWLAPKLWTLKRKVNSRVFQDKTAAAIVGEILDEAGVEHGSRLVKTYGLRPYCVQYQESDLAFVERVLSEAGIFYFFEDPPLGAPISQTERLVLGDAENYLEMPGGQNLVFRPHGGMNDVADHVERFTFSSDIRSNVVFARHFDFMKPSANPASTHREVDAMLHLGVYSYHFDTIESERVEALADTQLEQLRMGQRVGRGLTSCRRLVPGTVFQLMDHPLGELNSRYAVLGNKHEGFAPEEVNNHGTEAPPVYCNSFVCVPAHTPARPRRRPRHVQQVMETATVVGPEGEEIFVDEQGRIKVQFHWDLHGQRNDHSSCFLRVMQPWAGAAFGHSFIPRVGMEVVVTFSGGDVDKPLALGCVYNGVAPTPHVLPQHQTRSGIRTQSSPGGRGSNEIMFEDKAGAEQLVIHAQRDLNALVEHDHVRHVKNDENVHVEGNRETAIEKSNARSVTGNETVAIEGSRVVHIMGKELVIVDGGPSVATAAVGASLSFVASPVAGPTRHEVALGGADVATVGEPFSRAALDAIVSFRASRLPRELDQRADAMVATTTDVVEHGDRLRELVVNFEELAAAQLGHAGAGAMIEHAERAGPALRACGDHAARLQTALISLSSEGDGGIASLRDAVQARLHCELLELGMLERRVQGAMRRPPKEGRWTTGAPAMEGDGIIRGEGEGGGGGDPEVVTGGSTRIVTGGSTIFSHDGHNVQAGPSSLNMLPGGTTLNALTLTISGMTVNVVGGTVNVKGGTIKLN